MRSMGTAVLVVCLLLLVGGTSAEAHKIKVFAMSEGGKITGYVYFPGGERAKHVKVEAKGPGGGTLAETVTNEQGEFDLPVTKRCDHEIVANIGEGHAASFRISGSYLPPNLHSCEAGATASAPAVAAGSDDGSCGSGEARQVKTGGMSSDELSALVEQAVNRQIRPLREQIDQYEEKVRLHDILGGIGFIVGAMGLALYMKARGGRRDAGRHSEKTNSSS